MRILKPVLISCLLAGLWPMHSCQNREENATISVDTVEVPIVQNEALPPDSVLQANDSLAAPDRSRRGKAYFAGTLPCDGCDGVRTRLTLDYDSSLFQLRQTYLGRVDADTVRMRAGLFQRIIMPDSSLALRLSTVGQIAPLFMQEQGDTAVAFLPGGIKGPTVNKSILLRRVYPKG